MKQPDGTKVEITQGGYEDAMVLDEMPESQQHEGAYSKEAAKRTNPHDADQGSIDALNSLADTAAEVFPATEEPEPEKVPESNPLKEMLPGIKSMTIQFHEDSNPLRTALLEAKATCNGTADGPDPQINH